jgi:two-component system response regulator DevR
LSPRERDILAVIGDGTVKNHISRLQAKLGIQRRVQAAVLASHLEQPNPGGRRTK